ncbi:MAG: PIN domain-containing protein [Reyranella sp.]|uniref:PIN domain-containing protein n=1 Tax=Reyranella sp. TaxID=1929291 RepID=UPI003D1356D3
MTILLDTNVIIHLRDGDHWVTARVGALTDAALMSIVSRVELGGGVYRNPAVARLRRARLDAILEAIPAVAFDAATADAFRSIVEAAGYSRRKLLDRTIAAQALVHRATLVTMNGDDYSDIPGLTLLAWSAD